MDELLKHILALPDIPFNQRSWKCICEDIDKLEYKNIHSIRKLLQSSEYIELEPSTLNQLFNYFNQWLIIRALAKKSFKYLCAQWVEYYNEPIPSDALIPLISFFISSKNLHSETILKKLDWLSFTSTGSMGYQMTTLYSAIARKTAMNQISMDTHENKAIHLAIIIRGKIKLRDLMQYTKEYYQTLLVEIKKIIKEHDPISYAQYYQNTSYSLQGVLDQIMLESEFYDKPTSCFELIHPCVLKIEFVRKIQHIIQNPNISALSKILSITLTHKEFTSTYDYLFPKPFTLRFFEGLFGKSSQQSDHEKLFFDAMDQLSTWSEQRAKPQLYFECEYFSSSPSRDISTPNIHLSHS